MCPNNVLNFSSMIIMHLVNKVMRGLMKWFGYGMQTNEKMTLNNS